MTLSRGDFCNANYTDAQKKELLQLQSTLIIRRQHSKEISFTAIHVKGKKIKTLCIEQKKVSLNRYSIKNSRKILIKIFSFKLTKTLRPRFLISMLLLILTITFFEIMEINKLLEVLKEINFENFLFPRKYIFLFSHFFFKSLNFV